MKKKQVISALLAVIMVLGMIPNPVAYAASAAESVVQAENTQSDSVTPKSDEILAEPPNDSAVKTDGENPGETVQSGQGENSDEQENLATEESAPVPAGETVELEQNENSDEQENPAPTAIPDDTATETDGENPGERVQPEQSENSDQQENPASDEPASDSAEEQVTGVSNGKPEPNFYFDKNSFKHDIGSEIIMYVGAQLSGVEADISNSYLTVTVPKAYLDTTYADGAVIKVSGFGNISVPTVETTDESYIIKYVYPNLRGGETFALPFSFKTKGGTTPPGSTISIKAEMFYENGEKIWEDTKTICNWAILEFRLQAWHNAYYEQVPHYAAGETAPTHTSDNVDELEVIDTGVNIVRESLRGEGIYNVDAVKLKLKLAPYAIYVPKDGDGWTQETVVNDDGTQSVMLTRIIDGLEKCIDGRKLFFGVSLKMKNVPYEEYVSAFTVTSEVLTKGPDSTEDKSTWIKDVNVAGLPIDPNSAEKEIIIYPKHPVIYNGTFHKNLNSAYCYEYEDKNKDNETEWTLNVYNDTKVPASNGKPQTTLQPEPIVVKQIMDYGLDSNLYYTGVMLDGAVAWDDHYTYATDKGAMERNTLYGVYLDKAGKEVTEKIVENLKLDEPYRFTAEDIQKNYREIYLEFKDGLALKSATFEYTGDSGQPVREVEPPERVRLRVMTKVFAAAWDDAKNRPNANGSQLLNIELENCGRAVIRLPGEDKDKTTQVDYLGFKILSGGKVEFYLHDDISAGLNEIKAIWVFTRFSTCFPTKVGDRDVDLIDPKIITMIPEGWEYVESEDYPSVLRYTDAEGKYHEKETVACELVENFHGSGQRALICQLPERKFRTEVAFHFYVKPTADAKEGKLDSYLSYTNNAKYEYRANWQTRSHEDRYDFNENGKINDWLLYDYKSLHTKPNGKISLEMTDSPNESIMLGDVSEISMNVHPQDILPEQNSEDLIDGKVHVFLPNGWDYINTGKNLTQWTYTDPDGKERTENVTPEVHYDYKGSGKIGLVFDLPHRAPNTDFSIKLHLQTTLATPQKASQVEGYVSYANNGPFGVKIVQSRTPNNQKDTMDLNNDGKTDDLIAYCSTEIYSVPPEKLIGIMLAGKTESTLAPGIVSTVEKGQPFYYGIKLHNAGRTPVTKLSAIDILPFAGDMSIAPENGQYPPRGSNCKVEMTGPVRANSDSGSYTILYSKDPVKNGNLDANLKANFTGNVQNWTEEDWAQVTMIKIKLNDGSTLESKQQVTFTFPARIRDEVSDSQNAVPQTPGSTKNNRMVYNSFALNSIDEQPNKYIEALRVGVPVETYSLEGRIYRDFNYDGFLNSDESLLKDVKVCAYNEMNEPIGEAVTDENGFYQISVDHSGKISVKVTDVPRGLRFHSNMDQAGLFPVIKSSADKQQFDKKDVGNDVDASGNSSQIELNNQMRTGIVNVALEDIPLELSVEKKWVGGVAAERIEVQLNAMNQQKTLTLTEGENWQGTFKALRRQDLSGTAIPYELEEVTKFGQYDTQITRTDDAFLVTNTRHTYSVKYEFTADGKQLPPEVMQQLPTEFTVNEGETVAIPTDLVLRDVKTQDGIWSFEGWDKTQVENVTAPVIFTGTWKFSKYAGTINEAPIINASDWTLAQGDEFNPTENVTASDAEDGDLTDKIVVVNNTVDTAKVGVYEVTYKVTDKDGATTTKTIKVTVNDKEIVPTPDTPNEPTDPTKPGKPVNPPTNIPQTGDNSHLILWSLLSLLSLVGVVGTFLIGNKRRKHSK